MPHTDALRVQFLEIVRGGVKFPLNLTNTQKSILEAAAARPDGAINPLPEQIKGGAALKVITALENKGLIHDTSLNTPYKDWRISEEGYRAIGQEPPQELVEEVNHDDLFEEDDEKFLGIPRDEPEEIVFIVKSHFAPKDHPGTLAFPPGCPPGSVSP